MKYSVGSIAGNPPENACTGNILFVQNVQKDLVYRFTSVFYGLVKIYGQFFARTFCSDD